MKKLNLWQWSLLLLILLAPSVLAQTSQPGYKIEHIGPPSPGGEPGGGDGGGTSGESTKIDGNPTAETIISRLKDKGKVTITVELSNYTAHALRVVAVNETLVVKNKTAGTTWLDVWLFDPQYERVWKFTVQDNGNKSAIIYYWGKWLKIIEQVTVTKNNDSEPEEGNSGKDNPPNHHQLRRASSHARR